jgi:succinate dehydrogenase / fumarate reductase iron-sulfur subunit
MKVTFNIFRYDPKKDKEPYYREYQIEVELTDRVLDCLNRIHWQQDPSLAFRMSCAHGVCGSDGMRINGICALACQRLVRDYGEGPIIIEPLPNLRVQKDLIVDLDSFFEKHRNVKPYLVPSDSEPDLERIQGPEERQIFDEAIRCILCACCTAACPITPQNEGFAGPAALLRAFRYLFDSRDGAHEDRMKAIDDDDGIWGCQGHGKCTEVCPKEIDVRVNLGRIKKRIHDARKAGN